MGRVNCEIDKTEVDQGEETGVTPLTVHIALEQNKRYFFFKRKIAVNNFFLMYGGNQSSPVSVKIPKFHKIYPSSTKD